MVLGAQLENFTIDQFAGALALTLGSIGGLLMIVWKSRCHCKFNLCWLCQCERKPPPDGDDSDDEETPQDAGFAGVNESEVSNLLSSGKAGEALKLLLSSAPIGSKNQADKVCFSSKKI